MKISELKRIAKENYYELKEEKETKQITLERKVTFDGFISNVITISSVMKDLIFIKSKHCDGKDFNMIKAAVEFAATPPEDREEVKKFYLKHRWMRNINGFSRTLKIDIEDGTADVGIMCPSLGYKNQFTKKEIEEIKEKFNTDLADFKEVEVEE